MSEPRSDSAAEAPEALLALAVEAAQTAGALLLERFERGGVRLVGTKSTPTDLVSEADLASQRAVRELLARRRPGDAFLGEEDEGEEDEHDEAGAGSGGPQLGESGAPETRESGAPEMGGSGLRWVVDPLDGTVNYLFGIPQWCVSVAVQDGGGNTLAGAIFDPCRGELFTASRGGVPRLNGDPIEGSGCAELASAMVATGFYYEARVRAEQAVVLARLIPLVRDIRRLGAAALDLAWSAAGRYDAYFERGVKLWDVAAGSLICTAAGLEVVDLEPRAGGRPDAAPDAPPLPAGLLAAAPALVEPLLAQVA